ncbi:methyltransferase family protein [alpha proteobacterium HIMB5]|nr:methyltransferase family protein [alpha proteobacterium HIMB5]
MKNNYKLKKNKFGFFQVSPTPSAEEITKFYADEFYTGEYKNFNDSSLEVQISDQEFFEGRWNDIYNNFLEVDNNLQNGASILDIGCGWGLALLYFKKKGFDCYGFDPAKEAVDYGCKKGLQIKHAGLEGMNVFDNKKFNMVTMFNVLEHLADPIKSINQIKDILLPNGILMIDVPNEFNDFQTSGRDVHGLNDWWVAPPNHLNYFSKDSLVNLLESLGFKIEICEASFPLEMFLLFGDNYVKDGDLGSSCHKKRVNFEQNLRKQGKSSTLKKFYRSLAELNLGRQITVFCKLK